MKKINLGTIVITIWFIASLIMFLFMMDFFQDVPYKEEFIRKVPDSLLGIFAINALVGTILGGIVTVAFWLEDILE